MAVALVLDTADGRLARLQGTSSAFGRWLDEFLDEMVDLVLHAAIAWSAFVRDGRPVWLLLGIAYASGKYLFRVQSSLGDELDRQGRDGAGPHLPISAVCRRRPRGLAELVRLARPCRPAVAPLDRAGGPRPARRRAGGLCGLLPGPDPGRRDSEGVAPCLSRRISVLVVARDEADNLAECLAAARWADERVVVVDAASRDATLAIARRERGRRRGAGLRRLRQPSGTPRWRWPTGDWVLSVDADERITPGPGRRGPPGHRAIPTSPCVGYRVPIRSEILGRPFGFSGTQHDQPLRLFRRDSGRWVGLVHETVDLDGPAGSVAGELRHRTIPTMSAFLEKINRYTTLEAEGLAGARRPFRPGDLTVRPAWTFLKLYVFKQGFRDGVEGFMFCLFSGVSAAVRAWKHRELTLARRAT